jgi:hypothetical protein
VISLEKYEALEKENTQLKAQLNALQNQLDAVVKLLAENKIRLLALGRKSFLFSGNHAAVQHAAMMYSFMGTCKANDVNPSQWLEVALEKLPHCTSQDDYRNLSSIMSPL